MNLTTLLEGIEVKSLSEILSVLKELRDAKGSPGLSQEILDVLKGIAMDTTALKAGFGSFSDKFATFSVDVTKGFADVIAFVQANVPQDTPAQIADVTAVVAGLAGLGTQVDTLSTGVKTMDALVNPPAVVPPAPVA